MAKARKTTKGRVFTRGKAAIWYGQFYVNEPGKGLVQKVVRLLNTKGEKCRNRGEAETALNRLVAPLQMDDRADQLRTLAATLASVEEKAAELEEAKRPKLAITDLWDAFEADPKRPMPGDSTLEQYTFQIKAFSTWGAAAGLATIEDVSPDVAGRYASHLRATLAAGTAAAHLALLRAVFKTLRPKRENPFAVDHVGKGAKVRQTKRSALSLPELAAICDAAEGEYKTLIFVGAYTAQRLGDCCKLDWAQVDLAGGWLSFQQAKTDEGVKVPISRHLLPILEAAAPPAGRIGFVMPGIAADYSANRIRVTNRIAIIFRRAGIKMYKPGTGPGTDRRAAIVKSFHSLRHTANTLWLEAGIPPATVAALTGHRTDAQQARYTHIGRAGLLAAADVVPDITGRATDPEATDRAALAEMAKTLPIATIRRLLKMASKNS